MAEILSSTVPSGQTTSGQPVIAEYSTNWIVQADQIVNWHDLASAQSNSLRVYKSGTLTFGVYAGKFYDASGNVVVFTGDDGISLSGVGTFKIYINTDGVLGFDTSYPDNVIHLATIVTLNNAITSITDERVTFSIGSYSGYSGFSGQTGTSGYSGINGHIGVDGSSGYSGYSGTSGSNGSVGTSGYSGYSGTSGSNGSVGTSGYSGYSGTSGSNGSVGTSGYSGYSGATGSNGSVGTSGYSGYSGTSGSNGSVGTSGYSGYSGATGIGTSGYSGYSGASGTSGYSGYSGASGTSGYSGKSGYSGYSGATGTGTSGYSGYSGTSGTSGYSGYSGVSGYSGYSGVSGWSGSGSSWTTLSAATAQNFTNSVTLTNDATLIFTMAINTTYRIRGHIFWDTTSAADIKYQIIGPASPTFYRGFRIDCVPGGTPTTRAVDVVYMAAAQSLTASTTGGAFVHFDIVVTNGSNSGSFTVQFAQNSQTNDAGVTRLAGSWMEYAIA